MSSFFNYLWNKPKLQPINEQTFLKVQFLTKDEIIHKNMAIQKLKKAKPKNTEGQLVIHNTDNQYKASFRQTFSFANLLSLPVSTLLQAIQSNTQQQFSSAYEFYNQYVETVQLIMHNGKAVKIEDIITLMDFEEKIENDPAKTLEVVYIKKGFFSRVKVVAKKVVVSIPGMIGRLLARIVRTVVDWLGLNSISSVFYTLVKSFVGTKQIMNYVTMVIVMFFPMLGPILGIAKFL